LPERFTLGLLRHFFVAPVASVSGRQTIVDTEAFDLFLKRCEQAPEIADVPMEEVSLFASNHEPSIEAHVCPSGLSNGPFRVAYERKVETDIILALHTSLGPVRRVRVGDLDESGGSACQALL
jgi:hypothetical protein